MANDVTGRIARKQAVSEWAGEEGGSSRLLLSTRPCYDTKSIEGIVDATNLANGVLYAVFAKGTKFEFFTSAIGTPGPLAADSAHTFTEADTNLTTPRATPGGNAEQVIEGLSIRSKGCFAEYASGAGTTAHTGSSAAAITGAVQGKVRLVDPSALVKPVECESPMMLEEAIFNALLPEITAALAFDNSDRVEKLCSLGMVPAASGGSYLRANGEPSAKNKFEFPEGYRWKRTGSKDSTNMVVACELKNDVVVALSPVTARVSGVAVAPTKIHVVMQLSLHGLNIRFANSN